jgi:transcriptional regulator with XRE-family HTH domain
MSIDSLNTDDRILSELGQRLARYRINRDLTQSALAECAGVSLPTVTRLEAGRSVQLTNWIRILRALDLLDRLDAMLPEPPQSPLHAFERRGAPRQRAYAPRGTQAGKEGEAWQWADDD